MKASHILLSHRDAKPSTHSRGIAVAMTQAQDLVEDIRNGKISFDQAARENSACPSKDRGGDLGWFEEEKMHPDFSNAVKVIPVDDIGPPVITPWGVHIVYRQG